MLKAWNHKALLAYSYGGEGGKPDRLRDPTGNALLLKVSASSKTWVVQIRTPQPKTITIGKFPAVGLNDARRRAADLQQRKEAGTLLAPVAEPVKATTCQEAWDMWITALTTGANFHGRKKVNKPNTLAAKQVSWRNVFQDAIGNRSVCDIGEDELADLIDEVRDDGLYPRDHAA